MSYNAAIYRGRQALHYNETAQDMNEGPRIDFGDGLLFRVNWGDPELVIDPTDSEWANATPMIRQRIPNLKTAEDGTTYWTNHGQDD